MEMQQMKTLNFRFAFRLFGRILKASLLLQITVIWASGSDQKKIIPLQVNKSLILLEDGNQELPKTKRS